MTNLILLKERTVPGIIEALDELSVPVREQLAASQKRRVYAAVIFAYWAKLLNHDRALLDKKREGRLIQRLEENSDDVSELLYAIDGARRDKFLMGTDPAASRRYDGIEVIFRDREQVERLAELVGGYRRREPHALVVKYKI